jgi:hypothetical protein
MLSLSRSTASEPVTRTFSMDSRLRGNDVPTIT